MHNDSVMDNYGKFLVGIGTGFIVFVGACMLWAILGNLGFPVASAQQASVQMLYFMLTGWGVVSFVSHLQKGLHKKVEVSEGTADFWRKEEQRQREYKNFYKQLTKQYGEHLQQIKATFGEKQ